MEATVDQNLIEIGGEQFGGQGRTVHVHEAERPDCAEVLARHEVHREHHTGRECYRCDSCGLEQEAEDSGESLPCAGYYPYPD